MTTRFTHPLREFAVPALDRSQWWRFGIAMIVLIVVTGVFMMLFRVGLVVSIVGMPDPSVGVIEFTRQVGGVIRREGGPIASYLDLLTLMALWPALWLVLRVLHKRPLRSCFGPDNRVNWSHFRIGLAVSLIVGAAAWLPTMYADDFGSLTMRPVGTWFWFAVIACVVVFIQTGGEELLFRGYMLQQFAARAWSPLGWSLIPSLIFAALHPTGVGFFGLSWFHLVFGLIMAAVVSRTANLGGAWGLHFGHNVINVVFVTSASRFNELSLFSFNGEVDGVQPQVIYSVLMFTTVMVFIFIRDREFIRQWRAARAARAARSQSAAE